MMVIVPLVHVDLLVTSASFAWHLAMSILS